MRPSPGCRGGVPHSIPYPCRPFQRCLLCHACVSLHPAPAGGRGGSSTAARWRPGRLPIFPWAGEPPRPCKDACKPPERSENLAALMRPLPPPPPPLLLRLPRRRPSRRDSWAPSASCWPLPHSPQLRPWQPCCSASLPQLPCAGCYSAGAMPTVTPTGGRWVV